MVRQTLTPDLTPARAVQLTKAASTTPVDVHRVKAPGRGQKLGPSNIS